MSLLASVGVLLAVGATAPPVPAPAAQSFAIFTNDQDIGTPSTVGPGSVAYEGRTKVYTVSGGENMWARPITSDYVWKKVSGDVMLAATISATSSASWSGRSNRGGDPGTSAGHRGARILTRALAYIIRHTPKAIPRPPH